MVRESHKFTALLISTYVHYTMAHHSWYTKIKRFVEDDKHEDNIRYVLFNIYSSVEESPGRRAFTLSRSIFCIEVTAKYKLYHSNSTKP